MRECQRRYGEANAKKIRLRLDALAAAESLGTFWPPKSGSERCHELVADRAGMFSVDVKQPFRLLFKEYVSDEEKRREPEGIHEPKDERERWLRITSIEILDVEDTHG